MSKTDCHSSLIMMRFQLHIDVIEYYVRSIPILCILLRFNWMRTNSHDDILSRYTGQTLHKIYTKYEQKFLAAKFVHITILLRLAICKQMIERIDRLY